MTRRPLRDKAEEAFDKIPSGPLGKVGEGDLAGAGGFLAVESTRPVIDFIPGVKQPGYSISAHGTENMNGKTRHTLTVNAFSKDVAEFAAQYAATPSNIDFLTADTQIVDVEPVEERGTYSTWRITVDVAERGDLE